MEHFLCSQGAALPLSYRGMCFCTVLDPERPSWLVIPATPLQGAVFLPSKRKNIKMYFYIFKRTQEESLLTDAVQVVSYFSLRQNMDNLLRWLGPVPTSLHHFAIRNVFCSHTLWGQRALYRKNWAVQIAEVRHGGRE